VDSHSPGWSHWHLRAAVYRPKFKERLGGFTKKMIGRLMAMSLVAVSLAAVAQSGDTLKQDGMKRDDAIKQNGFSPGLHSSSSTSG